MQCKCGGEIHIITENEKKKAICNDCKMVKLLIQDSKIYLKECHDISNNKRRSRGQKIVAAAHPTSAICGSSNKPSPPKPYTKRNKK